MTALNQRQRAREPGEVKAVNEEQRKALCRALGLAEDSTPEQIHAKAEEAGKALNQRGDMVPRSDLESAMNRAQKAEQQLREREQKEFENELERALNEAQQAGKFPPSSRDFYKSMCADWKSLERFKQEMQSRPALVGDDEARSASNGEHGGGSGGGNPSSRPLTEEEKAFCRQTGQSEEEFRKGLAEVEA
jgi:hypothetical protein